MAPQTPNGTMIVDPERNEIIDLCPDRDAETLAAWLKERPPIEIIARDVILQALAAGVVPRIRLRHVQVGRVTEVGALVRDIDRISSGGSAIRFVIGEYGAGKTFFLNLIRLIALERRRVTLHADLAPDRWVHASGGQARSLYSEAVRNMATSTEAFSATVSGTLGRASADISYRCRGVAYSGRLSRRAPWFEGGQRLR